MAQHFSVVQKSANLREKESPGGNEVRRQAQLMQKHIQDYKIEKSVKDSQDFLFQYIVLPWIQMICKSRTLEGDYAIVGILNNQSCMCLKLMYVIQCQLIFYLLHICLHLRNPRPWWRSRHWSGSSSSYTEQLLWTAVYGSLAVVQL